MPRLKLPESSKHFPEGFRAANVVPGRGESDPPSDLVLLPGKESPELPAEVVEAIVADYPKAFTVLK